MKPLTCVSTILFALISCSAPEEPLPTAQIIPSLDELSSVWIHRDTLANLPSLRNFRGVSLANRDLTSLSWLAAAPYSMGYHTGVMKVNGETVIADMFKWSAYETIRMKQWNNILIRSKTRMAFEDQGILWNVGFHNTGDSTTTFQLNLDCIGFLSKYDIDWQWWYPTPSIRGNDKSLYGRDSLLARFFENLQEIKKVRDNIGNPSEDWPTDLDILTSDLYTSRLMGSKKILVTEDRASAGKVAYGFVQEPETVGIFNSGGLFRWHITVPPGEVVNFQFAMAFGDNTEANVMKVKQWIGNFEWNFENVKKQWNKRWIEMFTPGNSFVSGNFPVLDTDDERVERVYYMSALTMLYMMNTKLPILKRVILTGGPRWGGTIMFYWDTTSWRTIGALSDPAIMRENLLGWLTIDINNYYGRDYFQGKGVGNNYSANYWAIFQMLHEYVVVTSDYLFLEEVVNGKTVLEHMDDIAYNWKSLSKEGQQGYEGELYKLADFGDDPWDLLEAVPTYIHIVPSFNAGYVGMMLQMSEVHEQLGNRDKSRQFKADADEMAGRILELYAGDGTWYSLFPNNKKQEVRHCLDFHFLGRYMSDYLDDKTKQEMMVFHESELETNTWMRAQSLKDPAAPDSDRPDHGPLGAYDGWPLNSMEAMYHMGYAEEAMDFYRRIYPVTLEGNWAQAHELWGDNKKNKNARVRIAERGWHVRDAASGIGMANVMLREFFGFAPGFMKDDPLDQPEMVRSIRGRMHHVRYNGAYYTIASGENGLVMTRESH